ncbi:hypothetical protein MKZ38_000636 [Zalerion maritima]|uniref:Septum-promoting GTP-binding protein 1 n=1 Tax=Zalerion maritima TaxID=339359 RepID=A0AAD5WTL7_9PEZI|nr:hypothetical protein MKZ38_000636 [Zalerion maritima]
MAPAASSVSPAKPPVFHEVRSSPRPRSPTLDSSTLSVGSPGQFHDALDTMDQDPTPTPSNHGQDDTLGGIEGSPNIAHTSNGFPQSSHRQSQSLDQDLAASHSPLQDQPMMMDSPSDLNARYANTPPLPPAAPSISRPASGLSGRGGEQPGQPGIPSQAQQAFGGAHAAQPSGSSSGEQNNGRSHVVIKVGMVGDAQIGKTSLMVKYVEGSWDEDYIQTLGVNFMEKTISIRNTEITFSIWDLGGQREFVNMLPLVCNDAVAILFMFDLTRKSTLNSIKEWYRQGRGFNKTAIPILVGTKYDHFVNFPREDQEEISNQARRFAKAMRAALIFSSTSHSINVQKIFKIVLSKAFDLKCTIPEIENVGEPLLLYQLATVRELYPPAWNISYNLAPCCKLSIISGPADPSYLPRIFILGVITYPAAHDRLESHEFWVIHDAFQNYSGLIRHKLYLTCMTYEVVSHPAWSIKRYREVKKT